jgi:hypothetical protein
MKSLLNYLCADFARRETLDSTASKYSSWLFNNISESEATWAASDRIDGVGQEADLLVFNPIFDPRDSGWYWDKDIQSEKSILFVKVQY